MQSQRKAWSWTSKLRHQLSKSMVKILEQELMEILEIKIVQFLNLGTTLGNYTLKHFALLPQAIAILLNCPKKIIMCVIAKYLPGLYWYPCWQVMHSFIPSQWEQLAWHSKQCPCSKNCPCSHPWPREKFRNKHKSIVIGKYQHKNSKNLDIAKTKNLQRKMAEWKIIHQDLWMKV